MPLTGTWPRSLDDKQRLALPKRLRDDFGEGELNALYAAPGTERSLVLYSPAGFQQLAQKIETLPAQREEVRLYSRLFYAQAEKMDFDSQGRVRLPERLIQLAGLKHEVVVLGVNDHAEVWDAEAWQAFLSLQTPRFDRLASEAWGSPTA